MLARADLARMREAIREMDAAHRSDDLTALTQANRRFHFTLFEAAGMPRMGDIIRVLWESTDRYRSLYFAAHQHRRQVNTEHRAILAAVRARDAETAVGLLRVHRENALQSLAPALAGHEGDPAPISRRPTPTTRGDRT